MTTSPPSLTLDVIGAGPAYTDRPGATGAAYLVRSSAASVLLDFGHGAFARLAGLIEPSGLDAVVISHLHPDHFIDLVPLRHYLHYEFRPGRRVRVLGPAALGERMDALHAEPGFSAAALDIEPVTDGGRYVVGDLAIDARRIFHTDDSYGYRVASLEGGQGLVYSGDCGRAETSIRWCVPATSSSPRCRSGRGRSSRAPPTSMDRSWARSHDGREPGVSC